MSPRSFLLSQLGHAHGPGRTRGSRRSRFWVSDARPADQWSEKIRSLVLAPLCRTLDPTAQRPSSAGLDEVAGGRVVDGGRHRLDLAAAGGSAVRKRAEGLRALSAPVPRLLSCRVGMPAGLKQRANPAGGRAHSFLRTRGPFDVGRARLSNGSPNVCQGPLEPSALLARAAPPS